MKIEDIIPDQDERWSCIQSSISFINSIESIFGTHSIEIIKSLIENWEQVK